MRVGGDDRGRAPASSAFICRGAGGRRSPAVPTCITKVPAPLGIMVLGVPAAGIARVRDSSCAVAAGWRAVELRPG